jgi:2'-5' RNA ligase superfamily
VTDVANHWWWRPGWRPGRRMYTWHVTFGDEGGVQAVAASARARLAGLPGLDLVPGQWLHLTTQGVGFADEVSDEDLAAITRAARARLAAVSPPLITIGPARVASEGVACGVRPDGALTPLRDALRAAIADIWGLERVPEAPEWTPHVSVAYSNVTGPADIYEAALAGEDVAASMTVGAMQLIRLGRDHRVYEWEACASVPLADGAARAGLCSASRVPTRTPPPVP